MIVHDSYLNQYDPACFAKFPSKSVVWRSFEIRSLRGRPSVRWETARARQKPQSGARWTGCLMVRLGQGLPWPRIPTIVSGSSYGLDYGVWTITWKHVTSKSGIVQVIVMVWEYSDQRNKVSIRRFPGIFDSRIMIIGGGFCSTEYFPF